MHVKCHKLNPMESQNTNYGKQVWKKVSKFNPHGLNYHNYDKIHARGHKFNHPGITKPQLWKICKRSQITSPKSMQEVTSSSILESPNKNYEKKVCKWSQIKSPKNHQTPFIHYIYINNNNLNPQGVIKPKWWQLCILKVISWIPGEWPNPNYDKNPYRRSKF